jgi:hypothetical protein
MNFLEFHRFIEILWEELRQEILAWDRASDDGMPLP